jgi:hypothetical protein
MSSTKMPNELECLAARLVGGLNEVVEDTRTLPDLFACVNHWVPNFQTPDAAATVLLTARALQFDVVRLASLVQAHDAALRRLYSLSLYAVDNLRLAGAPTEGPQVQGLQAGLATLADMQEVIEGLFPGDTCISS